MIYKIGKSIAIVSLMGYLIAMGLELWRPGFVVFFWNPQWLLLVFVVGLFFMRGAPERTSKPPHLALRITFAIVGAALVGTLFSHGKTALLVGGATFLLILGFV